MTPNNVRFAEFLSHLPAYVAGKSDQRTVAKLSSNENPFPPSTLVCQAAADAFSQANRYPNMIGADLIAALAQYFDCEPDCFVTGNGSISVLAHALSAVVEPGRNVVYPWRSFEAYPILVQVAGGESRPIPLTATGEHDLSALAAAVDQQTAAVILCSPNNPTGPALTTAQVEGFLAQIPTNVLVLLDQAYLEFDQSDRLDFPALLVKYPNLVSLRTFSKAYGLAGLRAGFAWGNPQVIGQIQKVAMPFGLNSVAQAAAVAALYDQPTMLKQVEQIKQERDRVVSVLLGRGWKLPAATGNFYWFAYPSDTLDQLQQAALSAGIQTRRFPDGLRVSVGTQTENDLFLQAIADCAIPEVDI